MGGGVVVVFGWAPVATFPELIDDSTYFSTRQTVYQLIVNDMKQPHFLGRSDTRTLLKKRGGGGWGGETWDDERMYLGTRFRAVTTLLFKCNKWTGIKTLGIFFSFYFRSFFSGYTFLFRGISCSQGHPIIRAFNDITGSYMPNGLRSTPHYQRKS